MPAVEIDRFKAWIRYKAILIDTLGLFARDRGNRHTQMALSREAEGRTCMLARQPQHRHILVRHSYLSVSRAQLALGERGAGAVGTGRAAVTSACQRVKADFTQRITPLKATKEPGQ